MSSITALIAIGALVAGRRRDLAGCRRRSRRDRAGALIGLGPASPSPRRRASGCRCPAAARPGRRRACAAWRASRCCCCPALEPRCPPTSPRPPRCCCSARLARSPWPPRRTCCRPSSASRRWRSAAVMLVALGAGDRSLEAAFKYFVLGAISLAGLLYGLGLVYLGTGSFGFPSAAQIASNPLVLAGVVLVGLGFAFELALFPFHWGALDAYTAAVAGAGGLRDEREQDGRRVRAGPAGPGAGVELEPAADLGRLARPSCGARSGRLRRRRTCGGCWRTRRSPTPGSSAWRSARAERTDDRGLLRGDLRQHGDAGLRRRWRATAGGSTCGRSVGCGRWRWRSGCSR